MHSGTRGHRGRVAHYPNRAISRDPIRYPDGDKFTPERFLNAEGRLTDDDPSDFNFGFGRRRCPGRLSRTRTIILTHRALCLTFPGRHAADASVWSVFATLLATLDFNLAKDADGNDITFTPTFTCGANE